MSAHVRSEEIRSEEGLLVEEAQASHESYYIVLALSTLLATFALLSGDITVESGAMVISPLMTPLNAMAIGLAEGKAKVGLKALIHTSWSIVLVFALSWLVSFLIPIVEVPELVALRSHPTLHDLLIAIVAGAIGMYGYLRKDVSSHLAGVAAAVSLEPPLAVMGISLAEGYWPALWGAAALFLTNVVAIVAAAAVVLILLGKHPHGRQLKVSLSGWIAVGTLLVALAVFLTSAFLDDVRLDRSRQVTRDVFEEVLATGDLPLKNFTVTEFGNKLTVHALNIPISEEKEVASLSALKERVVTKLGYPVELEVSFDRTQSTVSPSPER